MSFHCPPSRAPSLARGDLFPPTIGKALTATTTTVTIIILSHLACVSCAMLGVTYFGDIIYSDFLNALETNSTAFL